MLAESNHVISDEVDSNVPTSNQGASHSILVPKMPENEVRNFLFGMIKKWFTEFMRTNSITLQPSPRNVPHVVPPHPQNMESV